MKKVESKLNLVFVILFFLIFFISSFGLLNTFQTYEKNQDLRLESAKIAMRTHQLEDLTSRLNFLGQKHILRKDNYEMNNINKEIEATYIALKKLIYSIDSSMEYIENKDDYKGFTDKWESYWSIYDQAIEYSQNNNDTESLKLLIKANHEFEEFNALYIEPLEFEYYNLYSKILDIQNENFQRLILVRSILLIASVIGFIFAFYYLQKIIKESNRLRNKLEFLAYHDELTELPNRRMFQEQVTKAINESNGKLAIMYLDMDKLKYINDKFGHDTGDLVIKAFAKRIKECIRDTDILGRQGGDEFTILLHESSKEEVVEIANKIIHSFDQPIIIDEGQSIQISTSVGIAMYPDNGIEYSTLLKNADEALYEAKEERNTFKISKKLD